MKVLLMHPDRDFDADRPLIPRDQALIQDMELDTVFGAMANGDEFVLNVVQKAIISGVANDIGTILYRQEVLRDCLDCPSEIRTLYAIAAEAMEGRRRHYISTIRNYPASTLYDGIESLQFFAGFLKKLRLFADECGSRFRSRGFDTLFAMVRREITDEYLAAIELYLKQLKFRSGVLVSAKLGRGNSGVQYVLRRPHGAQPNWFQRMLGQGGKAYSFRLADRDEAGARIFSEMRDVGINRVANAVAQSAMHVLSFFTALRTELSFYVACLNLYEKLTAKGIPVCIPAPLPAGSRQIRFQQLRDVALAIELNGNVVGNSMDAKGKDIIIITGANHGGKSSFLRALGIAQLLLQAGMFVAAESCSAELCTSLFTHYKREEDATMRRGKLDEELARLSDIVDGVAPEALVLLNESLSSTNEREGSEIAQEVVLGLAERGIKVWFVTHLYEFALEMSKKDLPNASFLRAERTADGKRSFKILPGIPLETAFGADIYKTVFNS